MQSSLISSVRRILADPDIAIDLGTANTRLYAQGHGMLADEPSVVQVCTETGSVEAVGLIATQKFRLKRDARLISPLRGGVIADVDAAAALLKPLLKRARRFGLWRPRVLACVPTNACASERSALIEATRRAGASAVVLAPEPMAAAIGIGMDVGANYAQMLVDIGDGVTDIAVIRSGELIATSAVPTACSNLIAAVAKLVAKQHDVQIYYQDAQRLIQKVGTGRQKLPQEPFVVAGVHRQTALQRRVRVEAEAVANVMNPALNVIAGAVSRAVRQLPDELACEVIESGIRLTGGGACLTGISELLAAETSLEVRPARDPMHAVINGARKMLAVGVRTNIWATS
jgi:rod shape-determining protein MreB